MLARLGVARLHGDGRARWARPQLECEVYNISNMYNIHNMYMYIYAHTHTLISVYMYIMRCAWPQIALKTLTALHPNEGPKEVGVPTCQRRSTSEFSAAVGHHLRL